VPGVEKPQLEVVFEQVVDGLPIGTGGLHAHQLDLEGGQPVPKPQQPPGGGCKLSDLLMALTRLTGYSHARGDRGLMHVEPAAAFDYSLHCSPFAQRTTFSVAVLGASSMENLVFVLVATIGGARGSRVTLLDGLSLRHQVAPTSARRHPHFHGFGVARQGS
jgi:hypothetical protein